jgi:hypothetical protein
MNMKIDVTKPIKDYENKDLTETVLNEEKGLPEQKAITLRTFLSNIVNSQLNSELPTAEDLNRRHQLSMKLYSTSQPDLTLNERMLILERLPKVYSSPLIFGRISALLDPSMANDDAKESAVANTVDNEKG